MFTIIMMYAFLSIFWCAVGVGSLWLLYLSYQAYIGQITNIWLVSPLLVAGCLILMFYYVIIKYLIRRIVYKIKKIDEGVAEGVVTVLDEGDSHTVKVIRELLPPPGETGGREYPPIVGLGGGDI